MLPEPMEILEVEEGKPVTFHVARWEKDQGIIRPKHLPQGKGIDILRVHVRPEDKATNPRYWDITGKGAIALIMPFLSKPGFETRTFKLSAVGEAPKKRFELEVT